MANSSFNIKIPQYKYFDERSSSIIIASNKQRNNPIIKSIKNIPIDFEDIVPDFLVGKYDCVMYITLRYHKLHPDYLIKRLDGIKNYYKIRVLLCLVDLEVNGASEYLLEDITDICFEIDVTLFVVWSFEEAASVLEYFKSYENKSSDQIRGKISNDIKSRYIDCLTCLPRINQSDSLNLLESFGSINAIVNSDQESFMKIQGMGNIKLNVLQEIFSAKFADKI